MKQICICLLLLFSFCGCSQSPDIGSAVAPTEETKSDISIKINDSGCWNLTREDLTDYLSLKENNWRSVPSETSELNVYEHLREPTSYLSPAVTVYSDTDSGALAALSVSFSLEGETDANYTEFCSYFSDICNLFFPELSDEEINTLRQSLRQSAENQGEFQYSNSIAVCSSEERAGTIQMIFQPVKNPS